MRKLFITLILTITSLILPDVFAKSSNSQRNHAYTGVKIAYATSELTKCSFQYSPINFCDDEHVAAYNNTLNSAPANFNGHYIILARPEFEKYHQKSVVAIVTQSGLAYPLPIDSFSGFMHGRPTAKDGGQISYSINSNKVCIRGAILVYRSFEEGNFCFEFVGDKFIGHHTEYMYP
ncbi:TPA: hypothetical protein QDB28_005189 [Burkholderia vietnamiensis]|nr:hypothetical protein [Burkholderia vietnamiensis]